MGVEQKLLNGRPLFRTATACLSLLLVALLTPHSGVADAATPPRFFVGDFNGDRIDDIAKYDSGSGRWSVLLSTGKSFYEKTWATFGTKTGWTSQMVGDFNGDGKDDIASYYPGNGTWWVTKSTGSSFSTAKWATFSTKTGWIAPMVGDFNGDGKDDIAQYYPANGSWWVSKSTGSSFSTAKWAAFVTTTGWTAQTPGDFNGDGKTDIAQYYPGNGTWWVSRSTGSSFTTAKWATFTTKTGWKFQVVGDYSGDGKDDIANYYEGNGTWWVSRSNGSSFATSKWGSYRPWIGWSPPVVLDREGNGRESLASYQPLDGGLYLLYSTGSQFEDVGFGYFSTKTGWDAHVAGDFDGDGQDDSASHYPGNDSWWIYASRKGGSATQWKIVDILKDNRIDVPGEVVNIQLAIDLAINGSTVSVSPGHYRENLDFRGKNITVQSKAGPEETIVEGDGTAPTVKFWNKETDAVLDGFTITGGSNLTMPKLSGAGTTPGIGGGVSVRGEADPTIANVILYGNVAASGSGVGFDHSGGSLIYSSVGSESIYASGRSSTGLYILIEGVFSINGGIPTTGAIEINDSDVEIYNSYIVGGSKFGVRNTNGDLYMENVVVVDGQDLGVSSTGGSGTFVHITIANNHGTGLVADDNVGIFDSIVARVSTISAKTVDCPTSIPLFDNTLVYNISGAHFSGACSGLETSEGVYVANPAFASWMAGDFTPDDGSPAIDKGYEDDPVEFDIWGEPRNDGDGDGVIRSDLGAIEAYPS